MTRQRMISVVQWLILLSISMLEVSAAEIATLQSAAFASPKIPPPPPISMPVWSLSCPIRTPADSVTEKDTSMNIVTFAVPVSVESPKLWAVSLYYNTLTRDSMIESSVGVLQLLTPAQKLLVPILGKRSGYESGYSKRKECAKLGYEWIKCGERSRTLNDNTSFLSNDSSELASLDLLPHCASYIRLRILSTVQAGDHELALCQVEDTGVWSDESKKVVASKDPPTAIDHNTALYTGQLREEGII